MSWSAAQYRKFEAERNRPILDLLAQVTIENARIAADIGCGPGNSTEFLQNHLAGARVIGIDSAPDMIAAARKRLPGTTFELADISIWADSGDDSGAHPGPFDVIFANASLQWVPDHETLFLKLLAKLRPGGRLAVQMPDNLDEPAHRLMRQIAADGPWSELLAEAASARANRQTAGWYYALLREAAGRVDVWQTTYLHALAGGANAVVEWFKGTGLRPFIDPLDEVERAEFLDRYREAVARAYPALPDGTVLLPFPRLFIVADAR
jgi:trans-aconitate 2-methyltransferase